MTPAEFEATVAVYVDAIERSTDRDGTIGFYQAAAAYKDEDYPGSGEGDAIRRAILLVLNRRSI